MRFAIRLLFGVFSCAISAWPEEKLQYNRDIRPILSDNCFKCHGPDAKARKAKLRLDVREEALAARENGPAIVAGDHLKSAAWKHITAADPDELMPPPSSGKSLTQKQIELLARWMDEGAQYEPHWAYITPKRPAIPRVRNAQWPRTPIDNFILAALEERGIAPSPEADQRALLRRLSLDLTGLPPTPEETAAFLRDRSPRAFERAVDRLLASPHYGERMAVGWLDVARYADTVGYHGDQNQRIFPYRDYVIEAFNKNKPFDQFTIEQLAGDLLPNPTPEQIVATGFNRLNMMTREGGAQPAEYFAKYQADRVRTVAMTWLGSTMGCAECHDHKYDPFTMRDFYSLSAFFADIKQWGVYQDYAYTPNPDLRGWSNDHPFPPELEVESPYLQRRVAKLQSKISDLISTAAKQVAADHQRRTAFEKWRAQTLAFLKENPDGWLTPAPLVPEEDPPYRVAADGSIVLNAKARADTRLTLPLSQGSFAAIRVELLPKAELNGSSLRGRQSTMINLTATLKRSDGKDRKLSFYHADADHKQDRWASTEPILGIVSGWQTDPDKHQMPQTGIWLLTAPLETVAGESLQINLRAEGLGCVRVSLSPLATAQPDSPEPPTALRAALEKNPARLSVAERELLHKHYLLGTAWEDGLFGEYKSLYKQLLELRGGRAWTQVVETWPPDRRPVVRVLPRGNWMDESGAVVSPAPPHFLAPPLRSESPTRLDLAHWLLAPENPLTARVFVNRLWRQFFGTGLATPVDDLGLQGEPPSHPELLDWLAVEFRESGWNVKHIVKLIVTSTVYRQDSRARPDLNDLDPMNRLWARQNPRRLEAEFVRDNALAAAGLLNLEIGGPSAKPYQPEGYYKDLQFPDRNYKADTDDRQYRRGVYMHWQRTFLHPMLANFDAPTREECTGFRVVSNTPQQALTLLNDPTFVEAARVLAARALAAKAGGDAARLDWIFERALARPARPREKESLLRFLAEQRAHFAGESEEAERLLRVGLAATPARPAPGEVAAWTAVCRVVLNLHETMTRY